MKITDAVDADPTVTASSRGRLGSAAFVATPTGGQLQEPTNSPIVDGPSDDGSLSAEISAATDRAFRLGRGAQTGSWIALIVAMAISVSIGSSGIGPVDILADMLDRLPVLGVESGLSDTQQTIVWQWRFPRAVLSALVGSALALSGATYQGVFRNPLADPYLLGVAAGAGLGATLAIVFDLQLGWGPVHTVPLAAFAGALIAVAMSSFLGFGAGRSPATLLLAGVAIASFLTAIQTFVMQRNSDVLLEVYSWILGRLGTFGWGEVGLLGPYVVICGAVILSFRRQLDVMRLGDDDAQALGIPVQKVRIALLIASSLLAAAAVSVSGLISFVGIIVPHFVRLVAGSSYRILLPLSATLGAVFVVLADVGARNLVDGAELPIGVVTAFFGAPFFGYVLWRNRALVR